MHTIYIFNLISPLFYALSAKITRLNKETQNKFLLFLYSVTATLIVGTRALNIGDDTGSYYRFYQIALQSESEIETLNYFEPLFSLLGLVCAKLKFDFTGFNIVIAGLTMVFFSKALLRSSLNIKISIFLYTVFNLFYNMMNQVRQALAMAIILYGITYLKENEKKNL